MKSIKTEQTSNAEYHAHPYLSWSKLKYFFDSPYSFQRNVLLAPRTEATKAQEFGTQVHAAILEPDVFFNNYCIIPDFGDRRTKEAKEMIKEFEEKNKNKLFKITSENYQKLTLILDNFKKLKFDLTPFLKEQSLFYDERKLKARPDAFNYDCILDIKTSSDSISAFHYSINKYKYQYQLCFYDMVLELLEFGNPKREFKILYVQNTNECEVGIFSINAEKVKNKKQEILDKLDQYEFCKKENYYPMRGEIEETYVDPY